MSLTAGAGTRTLLLSSLPSLTGETEVDYQKIHYEMACNPVLIPLQWRSTGKSTAILCLSIFSLFFSSSISWVNNIFPGATFLSFQDLCSSLSLVSYFLYWQKNNIMSLSSFLCTAIFIGINRQAQESITYISCFLVPQINELLVHIFLSPLHCWANKPSFHDQAWRCNNFPVQARRLFH